MNSPAHYFQFGFIQTSLANLLVIALLILVFLLVVALDARAGHSYSPTHGELQDAREQV